MTDYRTTTDGTATEQPVHTTTIIEKRRGGSGVILAIIALALAVAVGFFYFASESRENAESDAVIGAAESVGDAARSVGDAAQDAADKLKN